MKFDQLRHGKWFSRAYAVGIGIKGFDGLVELITGALLLVSPGIVHMVLSMILGYAHHQTGSTYVFVADYIARLDKDLAESGLVFLIVFLIGHGVVKIALVYCLLRKITRAYPYALAVLVLFFIYQIYVLVQDPLSIAMWLFMLLDIVIIWLVWGEYSDLRREKAYNSRI